MAKKGFVKNTVKGKRRGSKYPEHLKTQCLYALIYEENICAIAKRFNVPESTLRTWVKKAPAEVQKALAAGRESELRNLNYNAAVGARLTGDLLKRKLEAGARNEERIQELEAQLWQTKNDNSLTSEEKKLRVENLENKMQCVRVLSPFAATNILNAFASAAARTSDMLGDKAENKDNKLEVRITVV